MSLRQWKEVQKVLWRQCGHTVAALKPVTSVHKERCEACRRITPGYDSVHYGSKDGPTRLLCTQCFNAEVAKHDGLEGFENVRLEPIGIADSTGADHQFHFTTRLLGDIVSLEAFELHGGQQVGYKFQLIGKPEEDLFKLLGQLVQRIRKALSVKHIEEGSYGLQIVESLVKGRIEWDENEAGRVPVMVVDGREITWDEFGQMLMSHKGAQFKLEVFDPSADV